MWLRKDSVAWLPRAPGDGNPGPLLWPSRQVFCYPVKPDCPAHTSFFVPVLSHHPTLDLEIIALPPFTMADSSTALYSIKRAPWVLKLAWSTQSAWEAYDNPHFTNGKTEAQLVEDSKHFISPPFFLISLLAHFFGMNPRGCKKTTKQRPQLWGSLGWPSDPTYRLWRLYLSIYPPTCPLTYLFLHPSFT